MADPGCVESMLRHNLLQQAEAVIQASAAAAVDPRDLVRWRAHIDSWIALLESQAPTAPNPILLRQSIDWLQARLQDDIPNTNCPALLTRSHHRAQMDRYLALAEPIRAARASEEQAARLQATTYYLRSQLPEWKTNTPLTVTSELEWMQIANTLALAPMEASRLLRQLFDRTRNGAAVRIYALIKEGDLRVSFAPPLEELAQWLNLGTYRPEPDLSRLNPAPRQEASGVFPRAMIERGPMIYPQSNIPIDAGLTNALQGALPTNSGATALRVVRLIDHHTLTHRVDIQVAMPVNGHALIIPIYVNLSRLDPGRIGVVQTNPELRHLVTPWTGVLVQSLLRWMSVSAPTPLVRQQAASLALLQNDLLSAGLTADLAFAEDAVPLLELRIRRATSTSVPNANDVLGSFLIPNLAEPSSQPLPLAHLPHTAASALIQLAFHWDHTSLIQSVAARINEELRIASANGQFHSFVRGAYIPFAADWNLFPDDLQRQALQRLEHASRFGWRELIQGQLHPNDSETAIERPTGT